MAQDISNDMESDEFSSINDTTEAIQIAQILKTTYYEMINQRDFEHLNQLFQVESGTVSLPTHMTLPDNVKRIDYIKYNKRDTAVSKIAMAEVFLKTNDEFLDIINDRDSLSSDVQSVSDPSGITLLIATDSHPTFYTSFDDEVLVFDAYQSTLESNLQKSMVQAYGEIEPGFSLTDSFTPDLPVKLFPGYLAEAKSVCFNALKQVANAKEEQKSRRQRRKISRDQRRTQGGGIQYPNYGRVKP